MMEKMEQARRHRWWFFAVAGLIGLVHFMHVVNVLPVRFVLENNAVLFDNYGRASWKAASQGVEFRVNQDISRNEWLNLETRALTGIARWPLRSFTSSQAVVLASVVLMCFPPLLMLLLARFLGANRRTALLAMALGSFWLLTGDPTARDCIQRGNIAQLVAPYFAVFALFLFWKGVGKRSASFPALFFAVLATVGYLDPNTLMWSCLVLLFVAYRFRGSFHRRDVLFVGVAALFSLAVFGDVLASYLKIWSLLKPPEAEIPLLKTLAKTFLPRLDSGDFFYVCGRWYVVVFGFVGMSLFSREHRWLFGSAVGFALGLMLVSKSSYFWNTLGFGTLGTFFIVLLLPATFFLSKHLLIPATLRALLFVWFVWFLLTFPFLSPGNLPYVNRVPANNFEERNNAIRRLPAGSTVLLEDSRWAVNMIPTMVVSTRRALLGGGPTYPLVSSHQTSFFWRDGSKPGRLFGKQVRFLERSDLLDLLEKEKVTHVVVSSLSGYAHLDRYPKDFRRIAVGLIPKRKEKYPDRPTKEPFRVYEVTTSGLKPRYAAPETPLQRK